MKSLTVAYITSRPEPEPRWFGESLLNMATGPIDVIAVDKNLLFEARTQQWKNLRVRHVPPKPTVWQGPHRLTKADWWAASNARNTALCLCDTEWIAFVDDRSVLVGGWMEALEAAMAGNYAVCGPYQKRHSMTVEGGIIKHGGIITGEDNRVEYVKKYWSALENPYPCPGSWWYGCSTALPLEWALQVNGYDETCDGLSGEDYVFGTMLQNNGYPIRFDVRMGIIEDRTPAKLGPVMKREDKGVSPNDKSHALLDMLKDLKRARHPWDLRQIRAHLRTGLGWPRPTWPTKDWYDGQPLSEL